LRAIAGDRRFRKQSLAPFEIFPTEIGEEIKQIFGATGVRDRISRRKFSPDFLPSDSAQGWFAEKTRQPSRQKMANRHNP
jgi:hypothetical protein